MLFIVFSQWSFFGRGPLKKKVSLAPPLSLSHHGGGCLTFLTTFASPEKRPLVGLFCGEMGINYGSIPEKKWFESKSEVQGIVFAPLEESSLPPPPRDGASRRAEAAAGDATVWRRCGGSVATV